MGRIWIIVVRNGTITRIRQKTRYHARVQNISGRLLPTSDEGCTRRHHFNPHGNADTYFHPIQIRQRAFYRLRRNRTFLPLIQTTYASIG